MPKISIVVPVYNVEKYLSRCIKSILSQTFNDFELILVDDGSSDHCPEICNEYAKIDSRVVVIHKKNGGVSSARNCGLNVATGEYVTFCDSDDIVSPFWIETMKHILDTTGLDICICSYEQNNIDHWIKEQKKVFDYKIIKKKDVWCLKQYNKLNMPWNKMFRRSLIEKYKVRFIPDWNIMEDYDFVLNVLLHNEKDIAYCDNKFYYYCMDNADSLTKKSYLNLWEITKDNYRLMNLVLEKYKVAFCDISESYYSKWVDSIVNNINNYKKIGAWNRIREILKSKECKTAFSNGSFKMAGIPLKYELVLRLRNTLLLKTLHALGLPKA